MKKLNPFFVIGTTGMVVTAILHIILGFLIGTPAVHRTFMVIYPVFAAFLTIGGAQLLQEKKMVKQRVPVKSKR